MHGDILRELTLQPLAWDALIVCSVFFSCLCNRFIRCLSFPILGDFRNPMIALKKMHAPLYIVRTASKNGIKACHLRLDAGRSGQGAKKDACDLRNTFRTYEMQDHHEIVNMCSLS